MGGRDGKAERKGRGRDGTAETGQTGWETEAGMCGVSDRARDREGPLGRRRRQQKVGVRDRMRERHIMNDRANQ